MNKEAKHYIAVNNLINLFQEKIITKEQFLKELEILQYNFKK